MVTKHSLGKMPGWHVDNGQVSTETGFSLRHYDLGFVESRICTEFKEVSSGTMSESIIFGSGYRLERDGNPIASREACKTSSREQREFNHGPNKVNRETRVNCRSNTTSNTCKVC